MPEFPITANTRFVKPEVLDKVKAALLHMHERDLAALHAIDPKYEKCVPIRWEDYAPVKRTIDAVHGPRFYVLED